jgi:hypothetical protein
LRKKQIIFYVEQYNQCIFLHTGIKGHGGRPGKYVHGVASNWQISPVEHVIVSQGLGAHWQIRQPPSITKPCEQ